MSSDFSATDLMAEMLSEAGVSMVFAIESLAHVRSPASMRPT